MIVKLIHNNRIGAYAFMLLLIILFWIKPLVSGVTVDNSSFDGALPLWKLFDFTAGSEWLGFIFSIVSAIIITLNITRLNSRYALLSKQSALPGYIFILLVASVSSVQLFNPIWIVTILFLVSLEYLFDAHNYRKTMKECFVAAFWISVASLISYKVIFLFPLLLILMVTLRLMNFKTFLAAIIGFILPWLFLLAYALTFGTIPEYLQHLQFSWSKIYQLYPHTGISVAFLVSIAFVFVIALFSVIGAYGTKKIFTRKQYQVFVLCGLYISALLLISGINFTLFPILAVPLSIIIAHLVDNIRSVLWQNILLLGLTVISIAGQFLL